MRVRLFLAAVLAGGVSAILVSPGLAAAPARAVSGSLHDGTALNLRSFCSTGSVSVAGLFDATFIGRGSYTGTITAPSCVPPPFCCGVPSEPYPIAATFVFTGPGGTFTASGTGTGRSAFSAHTDNYSLAFDLTIVSGTGRYRRAAGSFSVQMDLTTIPFSSSTTGQAFGSISGSISPSG
jgi:hypothetical protein